MSGQKSKNNSSHSKASTPSNKRSKDTKLNSSSGMGLIPEIKFKKVKKMSRSIRRIESEMSHIQTQLQNIENDLNTILKFINKGKKCNTKNNANH